MQWYFPPTSGGNSYGFRDPAEEHFRSETWSRVMREIIQNSLDARDKPDKPVRIRIYETEVPKKSIGSKGLYGHMKAALKRAREEKNPRAERFYEHSLEILNKPKITALAVIDSNTKGLAGQNWKSLVHGDGTSSKGGMPAAGGSYGIGKSAPYLVSALKTVCYSTRYSDGGSVHKRLIGRSKIVTHESPYDGEELQNIGLGSRPGQRKNARPGPIEGDAIPNEFRLSEAGTGIFIMGFEPKVRNWVREARKSISRNFFMAIHNKTLEIDLQEGVINSDTLEEIFETYRQSDKLRYRYYRIIRDPKEWETISGKFGNFSVKVQADDDLTSSGICYVNRKGMLITNEKSLKRNPFYNRSVVGASDRFAAVIVAADDATDEEIRKMEPPSHESISYRSIEDAEEREEKKSQLMEIRDLLTKVIEKELGTGGGRGAILTELSDVLPLPDGSGVKDAGHNNVYADGMLETRMLRSRITHRGVRMPNEDGGAPDPEPDDPDGRGRRTRPGRRRRRRGDRPATPAGNITRERITRTNSGLRIAFTPKKDHHEEGITFSVMPAGEDQGKERSIPLSQVSVVSPQNVAVSRTSRTITVKPGSDGRIIIDLAVQDDQPYTGYGIVEYIDKDRKGSVK